MEMKGGLDEKSKCEEQCTKEPEETENMLPSADIEEELDEYCKQMAITDDISCGIGCLRGRWLQAFANKKVFIILYGLTGCCLSSTYAYFNGTITTIEKRFKIPSKMTGFISVGNDITQFFASVILSYYGGRGHRPRWIAAGIYCVAAFCFLNALPHVLYGAGEDSLKLTLEYGNLTETPENVTVKTGKGLCLHKDNVECEVGENNLAAIGLLFLAQLISGLGGPLYYSLGFSYMDDNIKKSKSPAFISLSYFIRTLGPPIGYALSSACLKLYIEPYFTPMIDTKDPRWLGAWWLGWVVLGIGLVVFGSILMLMPKTLPRAAARKELYRQKSKDNRKMDSEKPSLKDMMKSLKNILSNKIYLFSHLSGVFYVFGYLPFWIFLPKYIETQYRQSASASSMITGTVGLVCSALGILVSGIVIQRFKPKAKYMAAWNVLIGAIAVGGIITYTFLGCEDIHRLEPTFENEIRNSTGASATCSSNCSCAFVKYSPVCAADRSQTFPSACHAGCRGELRAPNGTKIFTNCACVDAATNFGFSNDSAFSGYSWALPTPRKSYEGLGSSGSMEYKEENSGGGVAISGPCPVDCMRQFNFFLIIVCLLKFSGATGRVTNFLVSVRCVEEKDKALSLGIAMTAMSIFAMMPSPIVFGYIMDSACMVWGKTCSGTGNCWHYNAETFRYRMNITSAVFVAIGTLFDLAVFFVVKNLNVYDENQELFTSSGNGETEYDERKMEDEKEVNRSLETLDRYDGARKSSMAS